MVQQFQDYASRHRLCQKGQPVLLAISGGVDSVVMMDLFHRAGFSFAIAHCNFGLRGEESEQDEQFVRQLAAKYGVAVYVERMPPAQYATEHGVSVQMAARELRYEWLATIRRQHGFSAIATAHHQDDSIETALMNLAKGTGIRGLHGILPNNGHVIRPLLFAFREEIENYAAEQGLNYREDSTNTSLKYERNYLRHQVLPALETLNPSLRQTMAENINRLHEAEQIFEQGLRYYRKKLLRERNGVVYIPIRQLQQYTAPATILYELLKEYGFGADQVQQILQSLDEHPGKQFFAGKYRLIKDRKFLIVAPKEDQQAGPFSIPANKKQLTLRDGELRFQKGPAAKVKVKADADTVFLDFDQLTFPLTLRRWQEGDYFYPLVNEATGQKPKKKKLKRFFTDQKLSLLEKENAWVLACGERIVWVAGYRLDNRFKVTSRTKTVYKVKWQGKQ